MFSFATLISEYKDAQKDKKETNSWSDFDEKPLFEVNRNGEVSDFSKDVFQEKKPFAFAKEVEEPFNKQYATNITFKQQRSEQQEDHFDDSAKMKWEQKRLPEYYLYNFDSNSLSDIALKHMDADFGIPSDITNATDNAVKHFYENVYIKERHFKENETYIENVNDLDAEINDLETLGIGFPKKLTTQKQKDEWIQKTLRHKR